MLEQLRTHNYLRTPWSSKRKFTIFFCLSEFFRVIINKKWILKGENQTGFVLFFKKIS